MSSAITQLSCFSSIINSRRLQIHTRSYFRPRKVLNVTSGDGRGVEESSFENKTTPSYVEDASISQNGNSVKSHPFTESNGHIQEQSPSKNAAKIHDFCLGIPFGGLVLSGGLIGFIFTRNPVSLTSGFLFGGALLALSIYSMKVWRQGKSSSPFILGQAVLSVALLWKNFQTYTLTKKLVPSGFNVVISAAMLCFYAYVVISGGNPPPKKLKSPATVES